MPHVTMPLFLSFYIHTQTHTHTKGVRMVVTTPSPKIRMLWVPHRHFEPAHTHTHTHTHTHSHTHTYTFTYTHTHTHTHTLSHSYTHTHSYSHTHMHAHSDIRYMQAQCILTCTCTFCLAVLVQYLPPLSIPSEHLNLHYNDTIIMVNTETIFTRNGGGACGSIPKLQKLREVGVYYDTLGNLQILKLLLVASETMKHSRAKPSAHLQAIQPSAV